MPDRSADPSKEGKPPARFPANNYGVLIFVLFGALIALAFALASSQDLADFPVAFAMALLFVQWVVLVGLAVMLAWARLPRSPPGPWDGTRALLVFPAVCLVCSLAVLFWFPTALAAQDGLWFVVRNTLLAVVLSFIFSRYLALQAQWRAQVAADATARLNTLQAWIRPHFLFNAMNTIVSLVHERPDSAEQAALDLSDILRTGLSQTQWHSLEQEMALIRGYLRLEQLRLAERCQIEWRLADDLPMQLLIPPLLLQPLAENAMIHGISRRAEGGTLRIEGRRIRFGRIRFTVTNPLGDPDSRPAEGNQSALENIRQRLALAYEERYGLKARIEGDHFIAELTIPVT